MKVMKTVYVNDVPIGQASTWTQVEGLLEKQGIAFFGSPGVAEGPTGYFIYGASAVAEDRKIKSDLGNE